MHCMIQIGPVLTQLMKSQGLTLSALAKASGVPRTTLSEWTSNRPPKNPVHLRAVSECLGVTIHYLLFGEEDAQEPLQKILTEDFFSGTFEINIKRVKIHKK